MKLIYSTLAITLLFRPISTHAAWYWLNNPANSDLGAFVKLSALEYAETTASKELLIPIEDELKELLDDAKHFDKCEDKYNSVVNALKNASSSYQISPTFEQSIEKCVVEEEAQKDLESALDNCDLEYLAEELSDGQKVTYNKQISECKAEFQEDNQVVKLETTPIQEKIQTPVIPVAIQTSPVNNFIEKSNPISEIEKTTNEQKIEEVIVEENIEFSSEIQGDTDKVTPNDVSVGTPTFIQKIFTFFTNLFSW